jgi:galactokinase
LYEVHYPFRYERRARARDVKFSAELDFAAFFDQFELSERVMAYFVMRSKEEVDGHQLFVLTRLPMGASFAPSVAQAVTSALVAPLLTMPGVIVDTMIDNVRVMAHSGDAFIGAMRLLLARI